MSADALPYTLLILAVELAVGSLWVLWAAHIRGTSAHSFIKFCAGMVVVMAAVAFLVAATIGIGEETDGYPLDPDYMPAARAGLLLVLLLSLPYAFFTMRGARVPALIFGGAASVAGFFALAFIAQVFAIPTFGYPLTVLSLVVGAVVLGAVTLGMILGHWYLVTPRLPEQPLRDRRHLLESQFFGVPHVRRNLLQAHLTIGDAQVKELFVHPVYLGDEGVPSFSQRLQHESLWVSPVQQHRRIVCPPGARAKRPTSPFPLSHSPLPRCPLS